MEQTETFTDYTQQTRLERISLHRVVSVSIHSLHFALEVDAPRPPLAEDDTGWQRPPPKARRTSIDPRSTLAGDLGSTLVPSRLVIVLHLEGAS